MSATIAISSRIRNTIYIVSQVGGLLVVGLTAGVVYFTQHGGSFSLAVTAVGVGLLALWNGFQSLASTIARSHLTADGASEVDLLAGEPVSTDDGAALEAAAAATAMSDTDDTDAGETVADDASATEADATLESATPEATAAAGA